MIEELKSFLGKFTKKKIGGGGRFGGGGVRVDVNEELKFLCKFKKKMIFFGGVGGSGGGGGQVWGVRMDGRIEVFVKIKKKMGGGSCWGVGLGGLGWM